MRSWLSLDDEIRKMAENKVRRNQPTSTLDFDPGKAACCGDVAAIRQFLDPGAHLPSPLSVCARPRTGVCFEATINIAMNKPLLDTEVVCCLCSLYRLFGLVFSRCVTQFIKVYRGERRLEKASIYSLVCQFSVYGICFRVS